MSTPRATDIPWEWTHPPVAPAPPLRDLLRRDARAEALRYHVADRVEGALAAFPAEALRGLSPETASGVGARVLGTALALEGRGSLARNRMARAVAALRPDLGAHDREALLRRWYANAGRALAEFGHLGAICAPPRTRVEGLEHLRAAEAAGPVVMVGVHTGLWEMSSLLNARLHEGPFTAAWQPMGNRYVDGMIGRVRRRHGLRLLPASPLLARRLLRFMGAPGAGVVMLIDELSEGSIRFPLFGRAPARHCNASFALRAARHAGGSVVPFTCRRLEGPTFAWAYHPPLRVGAGEVGVADGQRALDAIFAPLVRADLDQWLVLPALELDGTPVGGFVRGPAAAAALPPRR